MRDHPNPSCFNRTYNLSGANVPWASITFMFPPIDFGCFSAVYRPLLLQALTLYRGGLFFSLASQISISSRRSRMRFPIPHPSDDNQRLPRAIFAVTHLGSHRIFELVAHADPAPYPQISLPSSGIGAIASHLVPVHVRPATSPRHFSQRTPFHRCIGLRATTEISLPAKSPGHPPACRVNARTAQSPYIAERPWIGETGEKKMSSIAILTTRRAILHPVFPRFQHPLQPVVARHPGSRRIAPI